VWPAAGLAQARGLHSSEGSALAQAAGSRLGETAIEGLGSFAKARLGEAISPDEMVFRSKHNSLA